MQENGDDSFSELNRIEPGMNGGWVQIMGPLARIAQFKEIETSAEFFGLQQVRWSPENIADTPAEALESLFVVPGSHYSDPEFSWKFEVAPGGMGFLESRGSARNIATTSSWARPRRPRGRLPVPLRPDRQSPEDRRR